MCYNESIMNIIFAAICPHPSVVLPSVGSDLEMKRAVKTIEAMKVLAGELDSARPDVIVVISSHTPSNFTSFSIIESPKLKGQFHKFGDFKTEMKFDNHPSMVSAIKRTCAEERIPLRSFNEPEMDYRTLIPLYFLSQGNPGIKVVPIGISSLSPMEHVNFGRAITKAAKDCKVKIAIVASGELSHRLSPSSLTGYSPKGRERDLMVADLLKKGDDSAILEIDPEILGDSGQSNYLPMAVLFGALDGLSWKGEVLSYESPFGIGYLVANLKISKKQ